MTVREYIGARYVPLYIGEWDNTKAYEPLSIVTYQGDSYTSRQAVPIGIEITNESYWVVSAAFNAQVEQYRQEVVAIDRKIGDEFTAENTVADAIDDINDKIGTGFTAENTVADAIDDINDKIGTGFTAENTVADAIQDALNDAESVISEKTGISYVGNHGAKEKDSTIDWQSVFDAVALVSDTIDFGNGIWYFDSAVTIPENITTITGNNCRIMVTSDTVINRLFTVPQREGLWFRMIGLFIDCNAKVNTAIYNANTSSSPLLYQCYLINFIEYGLYTNSLAVAVCESNFMAWRTYMMSGNYVTAIRGTTDMFVKGCRFFWLDEGISCGNVAVIDNNYFWSGNVDNSHPVTFIECNMGKQIQITNNEFDCAIYAIKNLDSGIVNNNNFFWNDHDNTFTGNLGIFVYDRTNYLSGNAIAANSIVFNYNTLNASGVSGSKVYSFIHTDPTKSVLVGYTSKDNTCNVPDSLFAKFAISCGFGSLYAGQNTGADYQYAHAIVPVDPTDQVFWYPALEIVTKPGIGYIESRKNLKTYNNLVSGTNGALQNFLYPTNLNPNSTLYLANGDFRLISEFNIPFNSSAQNIEWQHESIPDTGYTVVARS